MTTKAREQFENGTRTLRTGNVAICAMSPQARQWLDAAIQAYCEHKDVSSDALCSDTDDAKHISVYGFAYWLFRYSGLPQRIEQAGYQAGLEAAARMAELIFYVSEK